MQYFEDLPQHALDILGLFKLDICRIDITDGVYEVELCGNISIELDVINGISNFKQFHMVSEADNGNLLVFINELYIVRGLPCSGKSELAETLANTFASAGLKSIVACADDFFVRDGVYTFNAENLGYAHNWCKNVVEHSMDSKFDAIILSNTSTTLKELKPYLKMAEMHNYKVISLIVENRHGSKDIHNVPQSSLDKMESRFNVKLI